MSNLLCQRVSREVGGAESLTLGVASSPFSGAGRGTIELMLNAMRVPAVRFEDGRRVEEPRMRAGPRLDFGGATRPTGYLSLAEPSLLRQSTPARDIDVLFAPKPSLLLAAFTAVPPVLVRQGWFVGVLRAYFTVLRRFLLHSVSSAVELVAVARRGATEVRREVRATDGMAAAGFALAAMVEQLGSAPAWQGVRCIDEVCELERVVARTNELAGSPLLTVR